MQCRVLAPNQTGKQRDQTICDGDAMHGMMFSSIVRDGRDLNGGRRFASLATSYAKHPRFVSRRYPRRGFGNIQTRALGSP